MVDRVQQSTIFLCAMFFFAGGLHAENKNEFRIVLIENAEGVAALDGSVVHSILDARDMARKFHGKNPREVVTIEIKSGKYFLPENMSFGMEDSYTNWIGDKNSNPIFDCAVSLPHINATTDGCWEIAVPRDYCSGRRPRLVELNGEPIPCSRFPIAGTLRFAGCDEEKMSGECYAKSNSVIVYSGDLKNIQLSQDGIEIIIPHFWVDSHLDVEKYDEKTGRITFHPTAQFRLSNDYQAQPGVYWLENVPDPGPGHWRIDLQSSKIIYRPLPGQVLQSCSISIGGKAGIFDIRGAISEGESKYVRELNFSNIQFSGSDERLVKVDTSEEQSAIYKKAALTVNYASDIGFSDCIIDNCAGYGLKYGLGCHNCLVEGCLFNDLGGGGIHIQGGDAQSKDQDRIHNIIIKNCTVSNYGGKYHSSAGIVIQNAFNCEISNCSIHDGDYSGISSGWVWGYKDSVSNHILIENNDIYNIGRGVLSDLGGIYTVGMQPGTLIRHNHIHNVTCRIYGGWGIYLDAGSSGIAIEENIVEDCSDGAIFQHFGKENKIENNIFSGSVAQIALQSAANESYHLVGNIIISDSAEALNPQWMMKCVGQINKNCWISTAKMSNTWSGIPFSKWQDSGNDTQGILKIILKRDDRILGSLTELEKIATNCGFQLIDPKNFGTNSK